MVNKKTAIFICLLIICLVILTSRVTSSPQHQNRMRTGTYNLELRSQGYKWKYSVQIPPQYNPQKPIPLVLILHGFGGTGDFYLDHAGWKDKANSAGFIAVAPNGLPAQPLLPRKTRVWNTGELDPGSYRSKIDDVQFFVTLLDTLESNFNIDRQRIYITGHSNGGSMAFLLGARLSERLAAIAPVASPLFVKNPQLTRPVSTLYIIGKSDPIVPFSGGETRLPWGQIRKTFPVMEYLEIWAKANGCSSNPRSLPSQPSVEVISYNPCRNNRKFLAYFIQGQGHAWPGSPSVLSNTITGPDTNNLNATDVIWDFFKQQTR
jgi:polyhydroxybutyrate depolymerase